MNPCYIGYGQTEVWCFIVLGVDCTGHARTQGSQSITWWLLAVFDLDESRNDYCGV